MEVAESIPRRNPRRGRPRRQAASVPCGWPRTEEGERPAWLEPARSSQPRAGAARAQPEREKTWARCNARPPRTRNRKRIFEICLACCIALELSRRRRRSARATGYAEPRRGHCGGSGRQHTEAVPMWRSAEAASALFFCGLAAHHEKRKSNLAKTGKITAAGSWAGAAAARLRGNHGGLLRVAEASARLKTDLQALLSLLHNVKVSGRRRRSAATTGYAEPPSEALRWRWPNAYRSCTHAAGG